MHQFKHVTWTSVSFHTNLFAPTLCVTVKLQSTSFSLGLTGVAETPEVCPCEGLDGYVWFKNSHFPPNHKNKERKKKRKKCLCYTGRDQNGKERHFVLPDKDGLSIFINLHSQDNCSCLVRGLCLWTYIPESIFRHVSKR